MASPTVVPARCRFTVLGPPGPRCGAAEPGSPQQQAVLAALPAARGRLVPIGELVDGLWGERAPATGEAVVRTYGSRLRRLFAGHGLSSALRSRAGGYLLDPALFAYDATEFTELVDTARRQRAEGGRGGRRRAPRSRG